MRKRMLLLPLLAAVYAAACFDPGSMHSPNLVQSERDWRFAIMAFAASCSALLIYEERKR